MLSLSEPFDKFLNDEALWKFKFRSLERDNKLIYKSNYISKSQSYEEISWWWISQLVKN